MHRIVGVAAILLSLCAVGAFAGDPAANNEIGVAPERTFALGDIDSVNLMNGNLTLRVDIGQPLPIDSQMKVALGLSYNSHQWDYASLQESCGTTEIRDKTVEAPNAGFGWVFSLGRLYQSCAASNQIPDTFNYETPDGAVHTFGKSAADSTSSRDVYYTNDDAHLRMIFDHDLHHATVEFPDGDVHTFTEQQCGSRPRVSEWPLASLADRANNSVSVTYSNNGLTWTIADRQGRSVVANFRQPTDALYHTRILDSLTVDVYPGSKAPSGRATYSFVYDDPVVLERPWRTDACPQSTFKAPLLRRVLLPDGSFWKFDYDTDGKLQGFNYPAGARVDYTWESFALPGESCGPAGIPSIGVRTRTSNDGNGNSAVTEYEHVVSDPPASLPQNYCPLPPPGGTLGLLPQEELKVTVKTANKQSVVHYFSVWRGDDLSDRGFNNTEYGLPVTHSKPAIGDMLLSSAVFDCSSGTCAATPIRETYNKYERDCETCEARVSKSRTVYYDHVVGGVPRYVENESSDWDGYGHYRTTTVRGNQQPGLEKTVRTLYNLIDPLVGNVNETVAGHPKFPDTSRRIGPLDPWALNTFSARITTENGQTSKQLSYFNWDTALVMRTRALKGAPVDANDPLSLYSATDGAGQWIVGAHDIVTDYTYDAHGNVQREAVFGGDRQSVGTAGTLSDMTLPSTAAFAATHEYQFGRLTRTVIDGASFDSARQQVDKSGLTSASWDSAGVRTTYDYDQLGRLIETNPSNDNGTPGLARGGWTKSTYTATAPPHVSVQRLDSSAAVIGESSIDYDGMGRAIRESTKLPDGTWSIKETHYDAIGWIDWNSQPGNVSDKRTYYRKYDSFGRAGVIHPSDENLTAPPTDSDLHEADTLVSYVGVGRIVNSVPIFNGTQQVRQTTVQDLDDQGRLWKITEPSGTGNAPVITEYTYDVDDHLVKVCQNQTAGGCGQIRRFAYDLRGFLIAESHPEKGKLVNGSYQQGIVRYVDFDTRGHNWRQIDGDDGGPYDLTYEYDEADRLTRIFEPDPDHPGLRRLLKEMTYSRLNGSADFSNGKMSASIRHNWVDAAHDLPVTQSFVYSGRDGRVGAKTTAIGSASFIQSYTYNELGKVLTLVYPVCSVCGAQDAQKGPARTITNTYSSTSADYLTGVSAFASNITYWDNGLLRALTHTDAAGNPGPTDSQEKDTSGIARPASITFSGSCTGPAIRPDEPADKTIATGGTTQLSVTPPVGAASYAWYVGAKGDTSHPAPNGTGPTLTTDVLTTTTQYWVRVTGSDCSTDSRTAVVTVTPCSTIVFDQQPMGGMLHPGASATLTTLAHGPANVVITYTWFRGAPGDPGSVPVGSGPTFVTPTLTQTTTYWVKASAGTCAVASDGATLSVCKLPAILQQPYSQSVPVPANGATASVSTSIVVDGTNVRIDWYEKVSNQFVATSFSGATLTIQFTAAGSRTFRARVHDDTSQCQGSVDSQEVTLTAADCIKLIAWTGDVVVYPGGNTFPLSVRLDGVDITQPIPTKYHFRWFHGVNGESVELNTPNSPDVYGGLTQEYDAFWCEITNTDCPGTVVTTPKTYASMYNGCPLPPLTVTPLRVQLTGANPAPPTFDASCDWPRVNYQWYQGSTGDTRSPITGATHKTFTADAALNTYWLRVTDECGVSHEDSPTLVVVNANINCSDAIVVTLQPQPVNIAAGQTTTLRTNATSSLNLNYYWYELNGNGSLLHAGSTYDVNPTVTTTYYARIMNGCFNVTTMPATVHVKSCSGITVTQQPQSGFVNSENNTGINLSITASAASTISYQWYVGETGDTSSPISGGTLSTIHVAPSATTSYWVRLTGPCTMDSDTAVVRYCIPPHLGSAGQNIDLQQGQSYLLGAGSDATDVQYNWHQDSATGPVISTQALFWVRPSNTTTYYLQLVGLCGDVTSGPIKITVCQKPWIDTQPQGVNVFDGKTATLTVAATENLSTPMTYQWYQTNGLAVGTNSPTFTTPPVHGETSYYVQVRAGTCSIESATATVSTCALPEVITSGSTFNVAPGQSVTFRCWPISPATGNLFTWYFGPVGDVTHSTLVGSENPYDQLTMYSPAAGTYWATVARQDGCVSHTNAYVVNVCLPRITTQPAGDMLLNSTSPITLSVTADLATSYQWYTGEKGNTAAPYTGAGSTTSSIHVTPTADTHYWVRVGGSCGSVDSDEVIVTVCIPPTATQNLGTFDVMRGQSAYLGVGGSGTGLTYQWYQGTAHDTSLPIGGDSATLTVTPSVTTSYWVRVTGTCGTADSGTAIVHVCVTPVIDVQPQNVSTFSGATATLSVTASESGTEPMHYQWYQVSGIQQLQVGTDSRTYTTAALTQDTTYWVAITASNCYVESQQATVSICAYPQTIAAPAELQIALGASVSLAAMPNIGTSQYIWYRGASGDTSSPITSWQPWNSTSVSPVVTTQYWYQLQNGSCVSNSTTTTVNVCVPTITTQPADVLINAGAQATLTVAANTPGLTYQWYIGPSGTVTNPVSGATNATLVVSPSVETTYWARVTSSCGRTADSDAATVSICAVPHIASFPTTFAIQRGQTTTLWVSATGTNLAYQWYAGASGDTTSPIFGNSASITVSPQYTSSYWVKVTGTCGSANSLTATVSVCVAPTITAQPQSVSIFSGGSTTLSVTASEATAEPMTYQWYRGTPGSSSVPVGTGLPTYTTPNLTTDTSYWVEVHCGVCNAVDSDAATVSICTYPQTIGGPADTQISIGQVARLFGAPSNGTNQYMWFKGPSGNTSQPQTGWQAANYFDAYPSVTTQYWYQLQNGSCVSNSTTTTVNVCVPTITTDPADTLINPGASTTLSVVATTPGLTYQWYIGTTGTTTSPIAGATGASVTVSPAATTSYWVRVTSSCARTVDSNTATVTVCQVPAITSIYPSTQWIARGQTASIGVNASGTNLTYQWYAGNSGNTASPIGSNSPGLSVAPQNTATYWVKVTGTCGSANSATATVQVCATPAITTQPQSVSIFSGASTTLSVTASEATTSPMSYQWYRGASGNQTTPVGTNSSTFTTPALTADTSYWVMVSCGTCNPAYSDAATVAMCFYPQTIGGPADVQTTVGQSVRLFGAASNGSNQYMWFKGPSGNMTQPQTGWQGANYMDVAPTVTTQYWYQLQNGSCVSSSTTTTVNVCVPTITTNPADTLINPGASTTLSVVATTPGLTYQWYIGTSGTTTNPIAGATGASVTVSPSATTSYWVRVTSSCARTVDSNTATVTVCQVPAITSIYPSTQWIARGQTASIGVNASGTNLTYQWYAGNSGNTASPIGSNSPGLSVAPQNTATYWVKVTGTCGSANSATATVQVCATPAITTQPQSVSIFSGTSTTLSVTASEATTSPMSYQWYRGASGNQSTPVGTNSSTFTTPALTADTSYWVMVSCGTCNPAFSDAATVAMCFYPQTIGGPADVQTTVGQSVRLFGAANNGSNQYMWFKGPSGNMTQPQTGWQGANYMDVAPTVTTQYWYQLQNGSCVSSSTTTTVNVCVPTITTNPQSVTVAGGTPTTLTVAANTAGVTYQWYIGASGTTTSPVAGGTSPSLTVSPASTTTYWARATSSCSRTVDSAAATVTICAAPVITRQPFNSSPVPRGGNPSYTDVIATGSNLTYQWYYGESGDMSQPISSRTDASLSLSTFSSVRVWVRVTGQCGAVNSQAVWLSIYPIITTQPTGSTTVGSGSTATVQISASGNPLHYAWRWGSGAAVPGSTDSPTLITPSLNANTTVWCDVTSGVAQTSSWGADITICDGPYVTSMPTYANGPTCKIVQVNAGVYGGYLYDWVWYQGVRGDTATQLQTGSATLYVCPSGSRTYWCRIFADDGTGHPGCYTDSPAVTFP